MKQRGTALLLAFFGGGIGVHRFYLGRSFSGLMYLLFCWTFIPSLLAMVDMLRLGLMSEDEFNRRYNGVLALPPGTVLTALPGAGYPSALPQAAYGGTPSWAVGQAGAVPSVGEGVSVDKLAESLEKLNELRVSGLLSEEEFLAQKQRLLQRM